VQKPNGSAGVSVADFDDGWWGQANSFYGQYAEDPINPEGTKCFRSYLVYWSGWGVFYTNSVTNLSQYAGGYIKFWYKSAGVTKIEVMSAWNGVIYATNFVTLTNATGSMAVTVSLPANTPAGDGFLWAGWGVFKNVGTEDLRAYSNGVLKFWLKSSWTHHGPLVSASQPSFDQSGFSMTQG